MVMGMMIVVMIAELTMGWWTDVNWIKGVERMDPERAVVKVIGVLAVVAHVNCNLL
jgi:hypothetical protein